MKYKHIYVIMGLLIIFFSINGVSEGVNESNYTVEYDLAILEEFNNQTWVPVLVRLVDNSNITVTGSKEERRALSRQIYEWFKPVREEVLVALSEAEFNLSGRRFNGFSGYITKEGFDKLLNNTAVREIIWSNMPPPQLATNESISVEYDPEILDAFINQSWINVLVRLVDNSNITIIGTKEEKVELMRQRDEWFKPKIDDVLSTLSEDEFITLRKLSNGFGASITREGFDKLLNNPTVSEINLDIGGSIALENNNLSKNDSPTTETKIDSNNEVITEINKKDANYIWIFIVIGFLILIAIFTIPKIKKRRKNV